MSFGENGVFMQAFHALSREWMKAGNGIHFITKKLYTDSEIFSVRGVNLEYITTQTECSSVKVCVMASVLKLHQLIDCRALILLSANLKVL